MAAGANQVQLARPVDPVLCADCGPAWSHVSVSFGHRLSAVEYGVHRSGPFCAVWLDTRVVRAAVMFWVLGAAGRPGGGPRRAVAALPVAALAGTGHGLGGHGGSSRRASASRTDGGGGPARALG